jgi:hypothetical protein
MLRKEFQTRFQDFEEYSKIFACFRTLSPLKWKKHLKFISLNSLTCRLMTN